MSEILGSGEIEKSGSKPPPDAKTLGGPDEEMEGASAQADAHGPSAMPPPDAKTLGWLYEWAMERNMSALTTALCTDLPDIDDRLRKDFSKDMRKREFLYAIQGLTLDDFTTHAMPRHLWAVRLLRELSFLDMDELEIGVRTEHVLKALRTPAPENGAVDWEVAAMALKDAFPIANEKKKQKSRCPIRETGAIAQRRAELTTLLENAAEQYRQQHARGDALTEFENLLAGQPTSAQTYGLFQRDSERAAKAWRARKPPSRLEQLSRHLNDMLWEGGADKAPAGASANADPGNAAPATGPTGQAQVAARGQAVDRGEGGVQAQTAGQAQAGPMAPTTSPGQQVGVGQAAAFATVPATGPRQQVGQGQGQALGQAAGQGNAGRRVWGQGEAASQVQDPGETAGQGQGPGPLPRPPAGPTARPTGPTGEVARRPGGRAAGQSQAAGQAGGLKQAVGHTVGHATAPDQVGKQAVGKQAVGGRAGKRVREPASDSIEDLDSIEELEGGVKRQGSQEEEGSQQLPVEDLDDDVMSATPHSQLNGNGNGNGSRPAPIAAQPGKGRLPLQPTGRAGPPGIGVGQAVTAGNLSGKNLSGKRQRFSTDEEQAIAEGYACFKGNPQMWKDLKAFAGSRLNTRSAVDIKDKVRNMIKAGSLNE